MNFITRLCVAYAFWKFVRWFDSLRWVSPTAAKTVKIHKPLPVVYETLPNIAGISAGEYFHGLRNRRAQRPSDVADLSDAAFAAWRAKNNR